MAYPLTREQIEETMQQGSKAFQSGGSVNQSPYGKFSEQGRLWLKGFANAHYGQTHLNTKNIDYWENNGSA